MRSKLETLLKIPVTDMMRAIFGFGIGCLFMCVALQYFQVNNFDFPNMQHGIDLILRGINPWADDIRINDFYNPPYSILFLWPMLFLNSRVFLVLGAGLLCAFVFYRKAWVSLAWFATNTTLWLISAGGIDLFLIGAGLLLLIAADKIQNKWGQLFFRVLAYGILLIKPQGGFYIAALYILLRRDWKGLLISGAIYILPFLSLYPDWIQVLWNDPPNTQSVAAHSLWGKFGPVFAGIIALGVMVSRKWKYWQLGGALAGIMTPYGMPGLPIFLVLSGVRKWIAIPIVVVYSGCLAVLTWVAPPTGVDFYDYLNPYMAIYHLSMLGLVLALACISGSEAGDADTIAVGDWLKAKIKLGRLPKKSK